jgi:predicted glycosyltransferase
MAAAELVISRTGYSTVMDLLQLQKKSILIPTPGQTEQEYLAGHLSKMSIAYCLPQHEFQLIPAIEAARNFSYHFIAPDNELMKKTVQDLISEIKR